MTEAAAFAQAQGQPTGFETGAAPADHLLASAYFDTRYRSHSHSRQSHASAEPLATTSDAASVTFPLQAPLPPEMQLPSHYPSIQNMTIGPDRNRYSPIDQSFENASQIDGEWFRITDKKANAALADAAKNGANVLMIEDGKNMSSSTSQKDMQPVKDAGGQIVMSSKAFDISHSKTAVVTDRSNQRSTWIGSMNITASNSRDVELQTNDPGIANSVDKVIQADVQNAQNDTSLTPSGLDPALVVSPVNAEDKLAGLIYSVDPNPNKGWVIASSENWGDPEIQKALIDVAKAGIPVRVLGPQCDENPNRSINLPHMQDMEAGGVQAKETPKGTPYEHLKMIEVMTPEGPVGYVGSINFSFQSAHQGDRPVKSSSGREIKPNRELGILFNDEAALSKIKQAFESDWATSVEPAACGSSSRSSAHKN